MNSYYMRASGLALLVALAGPAMAGSVYEEIQRDLAARAAPGQQPSNIAPLPHYTTEQVCPSKIMGGDVLFPETLNGCVAKQQAGFYIVRDVWPLVSDETRKYCMWSIEPQKGILAYSMLAHCLLQKGRSEIPDRLDYRQSRGWPLD